MVAHLVLALLLFPTIILAEPVHIPISHRSSSSSKLDINAEAKRLRTKYRRPVSDSGAQPNKRTAVAGTSISYQVFLTLSSLFHMNSPPE